MLKQEGLVRGARVSVLGPQLSGHEELYCHGRERYYNIQCRSENAGDRQIMYIYAI